MLAGAGAWEAGGALRFLPLFSALAKPHPVLTCLSSEAHRLLQTGPLPGPWFPIRQPRPPRAPLTSPPLFLPQAE